MPRSSYQREKSAETPHYRHTLQELERVRTEYDARNRGDGMTYETRLANERAVQ